MRFLLLFCFIVIVTIVKSQVTEQEVLEKIESYYQSGDFQAGIQFLESRIAKYDTVDILPDSNYTFYLNEMAMMYYYLDNYVRAESLFIKICETDAKLYGTLNADYAMDISNIGELYRATGNFDKALSKFNESLDLFKNITLKDSTNYYYAINNLGALYFDLGMLSEAEYYSKLALDYEVRTLSENDPGLALSFSNYALILKKQGRFLNAIDLFNKAASIDKNYYGVQHDIYAVDLTNLAALYFDLNDLEQGERLAYKAFDIYKNNGGEVMMNMAYVQNVLTSISLSKGNLEKAKETANMTLQIAQKNVSEGHILYHSTLSLLGSIAILSGDFAEAKKIFFKAIEIQTKLNPDHYSLITDYYNIANVYIRERNYDSAMYYLTKAHTNLQVNRLTFHPNNLKCESAIASVLSHQGKTNESKIVFDRSLKQLQDIISSYFSFMTENQRSEFYDALTINYYRFLSFVIDHIQSLPELSDHVFDMQSLAKGMLLNSHVRLKKEIIKDSTLRETYTKWIDNKERLSNSIFTNNISNFNHSDSLIGVMDSLEKDLNQKSDAFAEFVNERAITSWKQIQSTLRRDDAFVMFLRFLYYDFKQNDSIVYIALVLTHETKEHPLLIPLPESSRMDSEYYESYVKHIRLGRDIYSNYHDTASYVHFWKPLETILDKKKNIYVLPDGVYHILNIGALQISEAEYLCDRHNFMILNSVQDFLYQKTRPPKDIHRAVLFGDPTFDLHPQPGHPDTISDLRTGVLRLNNLPGTRKEVLAVDSLLRINGWETILFLSTQATEEQLEKMDELNLLIFSTHGFFNGTGSGSKQQSSTSGGFAGIQGIGNTLIQSMLNSGLYLTGAQNSLENEDRIVLESEDGILTSYEISNLTFSDLDLVVVSACQSGLGKISSDGIYGLQRSFRIAGANNVLISLWEIDDNAAQLFVRKFMEYYLNGVDLHKALTKTQVYFRTQTAYSHPYYWASFICVGADSGEKQDDSCLRLILWIGIGISSIFLLWIFFFRKIKKKPI